MIAMDSDPRELLGTWTLRRRVVDRVTGLVGTVHGTLEISQSAGSLLWAEAGRFVWRMPAPGAGHWEPVRSAEVSRSLRLAPADGQWWMQFADGRPFHPWRPGQEVEHPCGADLYRGGVATDRGSTRMRTIWDVSGPDTDQRLVTRLTR